MYDSPTSARLFLLIELERCIDRIEKIYVSQFVNQSSVF